jgi:GMP synthase-like glutamine amidotransferase
MGAHAVVDVPTSLDRPEGHLSGQIRRRWRLTRRPPSGRAVVLQDRGFSPSGLVLEALRARSFATEVVDLGGSLPDPDSADLAVVVGTARVSSAAASAWLDPTVEWLREADRTGTAVLALGSAAPALAIALGGGVQRLSRSRRSWIRVLTTSPQAIASGPWLAWEDDGILLPPKARLLARDHVGPQAFAIKEHLGIQFHPEATPELVSEWVLASEEVLDFEGTLEAAWRDFPASSLAARGLFADFVASVASDRE